MTTKEINISAWTCFVFGFAFSCFPEQLYAMIAAAVILILAAVFFVWGFIRKMDDNGPGPPSSA